MFGRKQIAILVAEFLGTGFLALVMLSVQHSNVGVAYFVALAAGLALATLTLVAAGNGGAHFNPAITLGMWTVRQIKTLPALTYIVAQMLGAWVAYVLYSYFIKTSLQPVISQFDGHVMLAEAVGALLLSMAYAAAVYNQYLTAKRAAAVGAAYVLAIIVASSVAIGIVNPAVAYSMRAFEVFGPNGWVNYAAGPVAGAVIGLNLYALLFAPESSFGKVRAVVGGRLGRRNSTTAAAAAKPAASKPAASKSTAKPTARRSTRSTSRSRKTTRSRK